MSGLPRGWVETTLGDIGEWSSGGTPSRARSDFYDGDIPWVKTGDLEDRVLLDTPEKITQAGLDSSSAKLFPPGTLLIAMYGATIGKTALLGVSAATNQACAAFLPSNYSEELIPFLWKFVFAKKAEFIAAGQGGAQPNISQALIKQFPILVPPLAEQKRIVAKLDALNAKSARARTELARIETLVSRYKQAVLSKAFSGELTASFERGNSAALLDTDSDVDQLWSIPEAWTWCRTDQIGRVGLGRQRSPKNHEGPQMRPYLRSANITWAGVDTSDVKEMNFDDADFKRFKLEVGDVLLNEGSGSAKEVGKPAIWRGEIADCCYQNTLLRVQPHRCSSEYAYYYFLLTARAGRFVSSTQGVNIQHIGREGLACYPFPLAPEPEQHEIVRRIESAFARIDRLAKEARRALELEGRLDEAILAKAFRGELVPQDKNDEPAEHLLARIRAERAAAPKGKRGRGAKA